MKNFNKILPIFRLQELRIEHKRLNELYNENRKKIESVFNSLDNQLVYSGAQIQELTVTLTCLYDVGKELFNKIMKYSELILKTRSELGN
jgi:hypothetical protein